MDPTTHLFDFETSNLVLFNVDAVEKNFLNPLSEDIKTKRSITNHVSTKIPAPRRYILPNWNGVVHGLGEGKSKTLPNWRDAKHKTRLNWRDAQHKTLFNRRNPKHKTLPNWRDAKYKTLPNWRDAKHKTLPNWMGESKIKTKNIDCFGTPLPFDEEIGDNSDDEVLVINDFPTRQSIENFGRPSTDFKSPPIVYQPRRNSDTYSNYDYHGIYVSKRTKKRELILTSDFKLRQRRKPKFIFRIQMNSAWLRAAKVHKQGQSDKFVKSVILQPRLLPLKITSRKQICEDLANVNINHNFSERMRRFNQSVALEELRLLIPSLNREIVRSASKLKILNEAAELSKELNSTESRLESELSLLRKRNLKLKWRLKSLTNPQFILPH